MDGSDDSRVRAAVAGRAARAGGAVALRSFRRDIEVETKDGKTDVVTRADRDAQDRVADVIGDAFPGDTVVGEEGDAATTVPRTGAAWVVDPIDGTNNYVRDHPVWATAVAAVTGGETVGAATALPALGDAYLADASGAYRGETRLEASAETDPERAVVAPTVWWPRDRRDEFAAATDGIVRRFGDLRRVGCAQATLANVAEGAIEGTVTNVDANPWDTVAGVFLVRQAGGRVTDLDGDRWEPSATGLVASNGHLHDEVLAAARDIEGRS
jgi:myo-inositol-1(or 4)-monophosphatase